jgi:hypothetical protein
MILHVISTCLLVSVAAVSFVMAFKGLSAFRFLPFHTNASGITWESLDPRLQMVFLSIIRINGFAFLVVGAQLVIGIVSTFWLDNSFVPFASSSMAFVFCVGLGWSNYRLEHGTGSRTPWRGSVIAAVAVGISLILSSLPL